MQARADGSDILVVNAGSSSIKVTVFAPGLGRLAAASITEIGGIGQFTVNAKTTPIEVRDHFTALGAILDGLAACGLKMSGFSAAAHRVVHGGRNLKEPARLTASVIDEIRACSELAPLHNPHNLSAIEALADLAPGLAQYASFDTAFHATNPEVALRYALPADIEALGIRRYGFHGISYAGLVETLPEISAAPLPRRLLALHLGNGASLCAIRDGRSVATTMGYSPLDGLTMGTRTGGIDGNAVLKIASLFGIEKASDIVNRQSGLLGLGGHSDMRRLGQLNSPETRFAIEHFCYWVQRHCGSMIAAMGGVDAMAFTGGIGENDARIRREIMSGLGWTGLVFDEAANQANKTRLSQPASPVAAWIVPADEELQIVRNALAIIAAERAVRS